ncbi:MAG: hypothetical protein K6T73_01300 [Candidatus Bathyarchaeota archaeon]|nr:hypothetical protein [Candidatus Bathyarchaeota archaeon]
MKIIHNQYYDDGYLGDVEVECDCGTPILKKTTGIDTLVECPECGRKGVLKGFAKVWIEPVRCNCRKLAERIVDDLFIENAQRLVVELKPNAFAGTTGWCKAAVIDRVEKILSEFCLPCEKKDS